MKKDTVERILREIKSCKEGCYAQKGISGMPLSDGSNGAKILIISQDPSDNAWRKNILFHPDNKTARQLSEVLGLPFEYFTPRYICWTHMANCDTGKTRRGTDRRPNSKCANKYLKRLIGALKPSFTLLMGRPALEFVAGRCVKIADYIGKNLKIFGRYPAIPISHTSPKNRILNNDALRTRQEKAILKIRKSVRKIFTDEGIL